MHSSTITTVVRRTRSSGMNTNGIGVPLLARVARLGDSFTLRWTVPSTLMSSPCEQVVSPLSRVSSSRTLHFTLGVIIISVTPIPSSSPCVLLNRANDRFRNVVFHTSLCLLGEYTRRHVLWTTVDLVGYRLAFPLPRF